MVARAWLPFSIGLLLLAILLRQAPLLLAGVLIFLSGGLAQAWAYYAFRRLDYERRFTTQRAFVGDEVTLEMHFANRKPLPMPWVDVEQDVPEELAFLNARVTPSPMQQRQILRATFSLGWYHGVTRRFKVRCLRRGYYTLGSARLRSGDLFGFFKREVDTPTGGTLVVYPQIVSLADLGLPSRDPFGDLRVRRHLHRDPIRTIGIREHQFGDPLKHVHWKATARVGRLQTRVFEPTTSVDLALFLDVRTVPPPMWGVIPALVDAGVTATAAIANNAIESGYIVGLYVNQFFKHALPLIKVPTGSGTHHLQRMLEALAQVQGPDVVPMTRLLEQEEGKLPWGATMVVITAAPSEPLMMELSRLRRYGRRVALLLIGDVGTVSNPRGVPVYPLRDPVIYSEPRVEVPRRDLSAVGLHR